MSRREPHPDLFDFGNEPQNWRHGDPETSAFAGRMASRHWARSHCGIIFAVMRRELKPLSSQEIVAALNNRLEYAQVHKRMSELRDLYGVVERVPGSYAKTRSGHLALRWRLTPRGESMDWQES